ncbi:hypothetical protein HAINFHK1212_1077, partial [Haemophilus influenzae HK1212]
MKSYTLKVKNRPTCDLGRFSDLF